MSINIKLAFLLSSGTHAIGLTVIAFMCLCQHTTFPNLCRACVCLRQVCGLWWITPACAWTSETSSCRWCPTTVGAWRSTSSARWASPRPSCRCCVRPRDALWPSPVPPVCVWDVHTHTHTQRCCNKSWVLQSEWATLELAVAFKQPKQTNSAAAGRLFVQLNSVIMPKHHSATKSIRKVHPRVQLMSSAASTDICCGLDCKTEFNIFSVCGEVEREQFMLWALKPLNTSAEDKYRSLS